MPPSPAGEGKFSPKLLDRLGGVAIPDIIPDIGFIGFIGWENWSIKFVAGVSVVSVEV
jgi:hypothetical protein